MLSILAITHGEPADALDYVILPIRYYYDSGSFFLLPNALAVPALLFDRLGHYESAATIVDSPPRPTLGRSLRRWTLPSPTCARSSVTRPTNRSPARVRR